MDKIITIKKTEKINLTKLKREVKELEKEVKDDQQKTKPDQETLDFWNEQHIVDVANIEETLKEKKELLNKYKKNGSHIKLQ